MEAIFERARQKGIQPLCPHDRLPINRAHVIPNLFAKNAIAREAELKKIEAKRVEELVNFRSTEPGAQYTALVELISKQTYAIEQMTGDMDSLRRDNLMMSRRIEQQNGQIVQLNGQIVQQNGQIAQLNGRIVQQNGLIGQQNGQIVQLNGLIDNLMDQANNLINQSNNLTGQVNDLAKAREAEKSEYEQKLALFTTQLTAAQVATKQLANIKAMCVCEWLLVSLGITSVDTVANRGL